MHTYIHIVIPAYLHTYLPTYLPTYLHIYIYTHTHTHTHTHTQICMHAYIHTHTYIHTYMRACMHTYVRTYIHTPISIYIHTGITGSSGLIADNKGDDDYGNNLDCTWIIVSDNVDKSVPFSTIKLSFTEFSTEATYDSVKVYTCSTEDCSSGSESLVVSLSSTDGLGKVYESTTGVMMVRFTTDSNVVDQGFTATWSITSTGVVQRETRDLVLPRESNPICQSFGECSDGYTWRCTLDKTCPDPKSSPAILKLNSSELRIMGALDFEVLWQAAPESQTVQSSQRLPAPVLIMQSDGDLVLYSRNGSVLWSTGTSDGTGFLADLAAAQFVRPDTPALQRCLSCPPGKYKSKRGGGLCVDCVAGKYSASGASSCSECSSGVSMSGVGSSTCVECAAGTYNAVNAAEQQSACGHCQDGPHVDTYLSGHAADGGQQYDSLEEAWAVAVCDVTAGGVTNRSDGKFEVRKGITPELSPVNEVSWVKNGCSNPAQCAALASVTCSGPCSCDRRLPSRQGIIELPTSVTSAKISSYMEQCSWIISLAAHKCSITSPLKLTLEAAEVLEHVHVFACDDYNCTSRSRLLASSGFNEFQSLRGVMQVVANSSVSRLVATWTAGNTCLLCQRGSYSTTNSNNACTACPAGKTTSGSGANASSQCESCPSDTYSKTFNFETTCMNCPSDAVSPLSSSSILDCQCDIGYSGPDGGSCVACVAGKFKASIGSDACTQCAAGKHSAAMGADVCADCSADTYSSVDNTQCTPCPPNTVSLPSSSVETDCACDSGYTGPDGGPCRADGACDDSCQWANNGECDDPTWPVYDTSLCDPGTDCTDCKPCEDTCSYANNGQCDDSTEPVYDYDLCDPGTDCTDCVPACDDTCEYANDAECDDPSVPGSTTSVCAAGTDDTDCGIRCT